MDKPKKCGQKWDEMTPTNDGRMCGRCDKLILDFSKAKWSEIEKKQTEHNNSLCGLYSPKQLKYWGQEPPLIDLDYKKPIFFSSLLLSLFSFTPRTSSSQSAPTYSNVTRETYQNVFYVERDSLSNKKLVRGTVFDKTTKELIPLATVGIRGTKIWASTDSLGRFELDLTNMPDTADKYSILASYIGYVIEEVVIKKPFAGTKIEFPLTNGPGTTFSVEEPKKKPFSRIRNWFRRK